MATPPPFKPDHRPQLIAILDEWNEDTKFMSSISRMLEHPNAQLLLDHEKLWPGEVVDLIIQQFAWGHVTINGLSLLPALTGASPWPEEHRGMITLLARDWLEWYSRERTDAGRPPA